MKAKERQNHLVVRLKRQLKDKKDKLIEFENEITALKRSLKCTKINELKVMIFSILTYFFIVRT